MHNNASDAQSANFIRGTTELTLTVGQTVIARWMAQPMGSCRCCGGGMKKSAAVSEPMQGAMAQGSRVSSTRIYDLTTFA
jgi:D-arabinose 1-dehydrogenase-like Zn-dependent alcohol dehydrogenase